MIKNILVVVSLVLLSLQSIAQDLSAYEKHQYVNSGDTLPYRILYPKNYDASKKFPVLLFLHGAGERGRDNEKQLVHGGKLFLQEQAREQQEAIVIFPQCPEESYWSNVQITRNENSRIFNFRKGGEPTKAMRSLMNFFKEFTRNKFVDKDRIYVGGLSMGAMGTYEILYRCPREFAAAFAICGGAEPSTAKKYARRVPVWIFHGEKDDVVPSLFSKEMAHAIRKYGGDVKLTLYPEANHNSWDPAFREPDFLKWLFSHNK